MCEYLIVWGTDFGAFLWAKWSSKSSEKPAVIAGMVERMKVIVHHQRSEREAGPGGTALARWVPAKIAFKSSVFTLLQPK